MENKNWALLISAFLFVSGCATTYRSGCSETLEAPETYRVVFQGNEKTPPERVQDFAMLRAAEITLQGGFTCFVILDEETAKNAYTVTTPAQVNTGTSPGAGNVFVNPAGGRFSDASRMAATTSPTFAPAQTRKYYRPKTGLLIKVLKTKPDGIEVFDATEIQRTLKEKYKIK